MQDNRNSSVDCFVVSVNLLSFRLAPSPRSKGEWMSRGKCFWQNWRNCPLSDARVSLYFAGGVFPQLGGAHRQGLRLRHPLPAHLWAFLHPRQVEVLWCHQKDDQLLEKLPRYGRPPDLTPVFLLRLISDAWRRMRVCQWDGLVICSSQPQRDLNRQVFFFFFLASSHFARTRTVAKLGNSF